MYRCKYLFHKYTNDACIKALQYGGISKFGDCQGTRRYVNTKIRGKINLSEVNIFKGKASCNNFMIKKMYSKNSLFHVSVDQKFLLVAQNGLQ